MEPKNGTPGSRAQNSKSRAYNLRPEAGTQNEYPKSLCPLARIPVSVFVASLGLVPFPHRPVLWEHPVSGPGVGALLVPVTTASTVKGEEEAGMVV